MIFDNNKRFIINSSNQKNVIEKIIRLHNYSVIMNKTIMTRAIYQIPQNSNDSFDLQDHEWIRIRTGDKDCSGNCKCTITFKSKKKNTSHAQNAKLEVEDYYEATHMFDLLGFQKTSVQQTCRTKVVCFYESIKYTVCLDVWPELEEFTFLTIEPAPNAEKIDVESFLDLININEYRLERDFVDVDNEYNKKFGTPASQIKTLFFDIPLTFSQN